MSTRISEDGLTRVAESVAGVSGVSSLNDATAATINKETFTTDPELRGWIIGNSWLWNAGNGNMEIA